jgi:hypothetical protein
MGIFDNLTSRSRSQLTALFKERFTELRIWAQENGEKAAIVTFILGLLIALFFRVFVLVVALSLIVGYIIWFSARED